MSSIFGGTTLTGVQRVLWTLPAANLNVTTDQAMLQSFTFATYTIEKIIVTSLTGTVTLAAGGFYTGAGKSGITLVAAGQAYSGLTGATSVVNPTLASSALQLSQTLYFSLSVANGSAATANIFITGFALS